LRAFAAVLPLLAVVGTPAVAAPKKAPSTSGKAAAAPAAGGHVAIDPSIARAVADPGRSAADRARDRYRHPAETLTFFGLKPGMTVVELFPGGGWYSAILAPYLAADGHYVAAVPPGKATESFNALVAGDQARYGKAQIVTYDAGQQTDLVPAGTADMVLTFRNIHNLLGEPDKAGDGDAPQAFADWYRALKPGGVLGIEEHRLPEQGDTALEKASGYVKRSTVIRLAMAAGFRLEGASDVNANPRDDHDHPKGVWTLPPTFSLGDQDRAKYAAIGESDRMTLRFVKPATADKGSGS
jgi:predicted methyltransferase